MATEVILDFSVPMDSSSINASNNTAYLSGTYAVVLRQYDVDGNNETHVEFAVAYMSGTGLKRYKATTTTTLDPTKHFAFKTGTLVKNQLAIDFPPTIKEFGADLSGGADLPLET